MKFTYTIYWFIIEVFYERERHFRKLRSKKSREPKVCKFIFLILTSILFLRERGRGRRRGLLVQFVEYVQDDG